MKEAYFKGMEGTRTFVSGPVDPKWNRYNFYCQICTANISIYSKGAREILKHHAIERHLRRHLRRINAEDMSTCTNSTLTPKLASHKSEEETANSSPRINWRWNCPNSRTLN